MTDKFIYQFGKTLFKSSDKTSVSPSDALSGKEYILLYFSAQWCGPCRQFTPLLIEFYNKIQSIKNIELIFCSLDNDEGQYQEYTSKMPWLSMPFHAKESEVMARKYKADGIPHLVVIDGATGEVVNDDATSLVREDQEGLNFPWKPKKFDELWPTHILSSKASEDKYLSSDTLKDKYLMLYFSAHWCPPCRAFTPKLSDAYTKLKAQRSDFELAFISSDRDESSFDEYFETMSFCALPFEHRDVKSALSKMFSVSGIPTLVMLGPVSDESGTRPLINANIRSYIENEAFGEFPFHKKNYGDIECADDISEVKTVIIFHENGDDEEQEDIKKITTEAAAKSKEKGDAISFLWAFSGKGIASRIRDAVGLPTMSDNPTMIMLDIPDRGGYYKSDVSHITVKNIMAFIEKPGDRLQLE